MRTHTKSHNGCANCKRRAIKCDEGKPQCQRCLKRNLDCFYTPWTSKANELYPSPDSEADSSRISEHDVIDGDGQSTGKLKTPRLSGLETELLVTFLSITSFTIYRQDNGKSVGAVAKFLLQNNLLFQAVMLLASAHSAVLYPEKKNVYEKAQAHYLSTTTSQLAKALSAGITIDNGVPLKIASAHLAFYSFLMDDQAGYASTYRCLKLLAGTRDVYQAIFEMIPEFAKMFESEEITLPSGEYYIPQIERIFELQHDNHDIYYPKVLELAQLSELIDIRTDVSACQLVLRWYMDFSPELVSKLESNDPATLVLLARFFYLLSKVEPKWITASAIKHYGYVCGQLPGKWLPLITLT